MNLAFWDAFDSTEGFANKGSCVNIFGFKKRPLKLGDIVCFFWFVFST